jgi:hypothetical protein
MIKHKEVKGSWNVADKYLDMLLKLIDKFYESMQNEKYGEAQRIVKNITNYTSYYCKLKKEDKNINEKKEIMSKMFSSEIKKLRHEDKSDEAQKILADSIQAMYDIIEIINNVFPALDCFVPTFSEKDPVKRSGEMD